MDQKTYSVTVVSPNVVNEGKKKQSKSDANHKGSVLNAHIEYTLRIRTSSDKEWSVLRRYSHFHAFRYMRCHQTNIKKRQRRTQGQTPRILDLVIPSYFLSAHFFFRPLPEKTILSITFTTTSTNEFPQTDSTMNSSNIVKENFRYPAPPIYPNFLAFH
jgi:hypothetical protein